MEKIIELAKKYSISFRPCFHSESTESYVRTFAAKRFENTVVVGVEITQDEYNSKECLNLFIDEFAKNIKEMIEKENTIVDEKGTKRKFVKRKKD